MVTAEISFNREARTVIGRLHSADFTSAQCADASKRGWKVQENTVTAPWVHDDAMKNASMMQDWLKRKGYRAL